MRLKATVIIKSEYHGEGQSDFEIMQGFKEYIKERIDLEIESIAIDIDKPIRGDCMDVVIIDEEDTDGS